MQKGKYRDYLKNVVVPCLVYGALTGIVVGSVVFYFKLAAEKLAEISRSLYEAAAAHPMYIPLVFLALGAIAVIMSFILKWAPETKGGGIPRAEGVLRGILTFRWLRTAFAVIANSFLSFFAGLPLGSEGPSVLLGTAIGGGTSSLPLSHDSWNRYIMTGGASAGFAVATNAPLTGMLFALEEAHKRFTPMILLMALSSVLFASSFANLWSFLMFGHGLETLFVFPSFAEFSVSEIWIPVVLGIVVGLVSCLFNKIVFFLGKLFDNGLSKLPAWAKLLPAFLLTGVLGLVLVDSLYGGGTLIVKTAGREIVWQTVLLLFCVRLIMIPLATTGGATGGVFIPMLSLGALLGGLMGELLIVCGMSEQLFPTVVVVCMAAFMGASTRTPITALVFVLESTWQFTNLLYVGITVFLSFFIAEILKVEPLYDVLLDRMTEKQNEGKTVKILRVTYIVAAGAFVVGKSVRDILWPANTKVKDITANDSVKRMDNDGEKKIFIGDKISMQIQTYDPKATRAELENLLGKQPPALKGDGGDKEKNENTETTNA